MRVNQKNISQIKSVIAANVSCNYVLKLFGSRVDDNKLGGDIDLMLIVESENIKQVKECKYYILDKIYELIGEQKIDLLIVTEEMISEDPFLKSIDNSILL